MKSLPGVVRLSLLAAVVFPLFLGCAGSKPLHPRSTFVAYTPEQKASLAVSRQRPYRIQSGDVLKVSFAYLDGLEQGNVIVLPDGTVTLREIDAVHVAGLTLAEADSVLTAAYGRIYRHPDLSVMIEETKGKQVFVLGQVKRPGLYTIQEQGLGIVNAIAMAGGFTEDAAKDGTVLVRSTDEGYLCQEVDLSSFHEVKASMLASLELEPYDVVYVPRRRMGDFAYFSRSVLAGIVNITRIFSDARYVTTGRRW